MKTPTTVDSINPKLPNEIAFQFNPLFVNKEWIIDKSKNPVRLNPWGIISKRQLFFVAYTSDYASHNIGLFNTATEKMYNIEFSLNNFTDFEIHKTLIKFFTDSKFRKSTQLKKTEFTFTISGDFEIDDASFDENIEELRQEMRIVNFDQLHAVNIQDN